MQDECAHYLSQLLLLEGAIAATSVIYFTIHPHFLHHIFHVARLLIATLGNHELFFFLGFGQMAGKHLSEDPRLDVTAVGNIRFKGERPTVY